MAPYITVTSGMAGYFAAFMKYYEDIDGYDCFMTGIGRYKTFDEAKSEAKEWAAVEGIDYR